MDNKNIRIMLVDNNNGRYIKSVYDNTFSEFLNLILSNEKSNRVTVPDFSSILEYFHKKLDIRFQQTEARELKIKIKTIYDSWEEFQSIEAISLYEQKALLVQKECIEAINWITVRIEDFQKRYESLRVTNNNQRYSIEQEKKSMIEKDFSNEINSFIQILLCYIHTMCKVDIKYFKNDTILNKYCLNVRQIILELLKKELEYHLDDFRHDSPIYYYCFNNKSDVNVELLLKQISYKKTIIEIANDKLITKIIDTQYYEQNNQKIEIDFSWIVPENAQTERIKILSEDLQKIDKILELLGRLKDDNIQYSNNKNLEVEIKQYLENKNQN